MEGEKTGTLLGQVPVFQCQKCGECCRGERGILVTPEEQAAMAAYLGLTLEDFSARYLVDTPLGPQLASMNGACVLQEGTLCRVHPVKPRICREWPFLPALLAHADEYEAAKEACPGIPPGLSHQEFSRMAKGRQ